MGVRQAIRWGTRHAIIRYSVGRKAARGDLTASLMFDPAVVADPWESYDALRASGPLHDNGLVLHTAHHDAATAAPRTPALALPRAPRGGAAGVLRGPACGVVGGPAGRAPRWLRLAVAAGGPGPL